MTNAIAYHLRAGAAWRLLPHDVPPWQTVYGYFRAWRDGGVWEAAHARLREDVRLAAGAPPTPETLRVDRQTVRTTAGGPKGYDGGKKGSGPKRFAAVDSLGLRWALPVTPADTRDRAGGCGLLQAVRGRLPRVREVVADAGFTRRFLDWVRRASGWRVVTTHNAPRGSGATPGGGWSSGRSRGSSSTPGWARTTST